MVVLTSGAMKNYLEAVGVRDPEEREPGHYQWSLSFNTIRIRRGITQRESRLRFLGTIVGGARLLDFRLTPSYILMVYDFLAESGEGRDTRHQVQNIDICRKRGIKFRYVYFLIIIITCRDLPKLLFTIFLTLALTPLYLIPFSWSRLCL